MFLIIMFRNLLVFEIIRSDFVFSEKICSKKLRFGLSDKLCFVISTFQK